MRRIVGLVFILWLSLSEAGDRNNILPGNSNGISSKQSYYPRHRRQTLINRLSGKKVGVPARGLSPRRDDCPDDCTCRRQEIRCVLKFLTEIPQDIPGSMEKIHMGLNKIREITSESFANHNDTLRSLYLHSNDIRSLDNGVFSTLGKLQVLRLSWNKLSGIRKATFHGLQSLDRLHLDNNKLTFVHPLAFRDLVNLHFLQLDGNKLSKLHKDVFVTLDFQKYFKHSAIQYLYLTKNSFTHLPRGIFDHMNDLKSVYLHSNPWDCSCEMKWLRDWMVASSKSRCRKNSWRLTAPTECAVCDWPLSLRGEEIENVPGENFTCSRPEVDENAAEDHFDPDVMEKANDFALVQHSNFYSTRMNIRLDSYRRSMLHASCNLTQIPTTKVVVAKEQRQGGAGDQIYTAEFTGDFECFPEYPSNSARLAELLDLYLDREIQLTQPEMKMANLGENTEIYSISVDGLTERPTSPLTAASISSDSDFMLSNMSTMLLQREGIDSEINTFPLTFQTTFTHTFHPMSLPEFSKLPWTLIRQPRPVPVQVVITLEQAITACKCKAVGQPRSAITWVSPSGEALHSGERNENFAVTRSGRLYFRRPSPEDSGIFHCIASIPDEDNSGSDTVAEVAAIRLEVFERTGDADYPDPAAQYLLENVAEGETWSSECDLKGIPNATVAWITPDNHLLPVESEGSHERVSTNQEGGITVTDFQTTDQGLYRCVAANIAGASEYSVFVSILNEEPDVAIEEIVIMDYDPDSTEYEDPMGPDMMETPGMNEPNSPSTSDIEDPKPSISSTTSKSVLQPVTSGKVEIHSTELLTTTTQPIQSTTSMKVERHSIESLTITKSMDSTTTLGNMEPVIPEIIIPVFPDMLDEDFEDPMNSSISDETEPDPDMNSETEKPIFETSTESPSPTTSPEIPKTNLNLNTRGATEPSGAHEATELEPGNPTTNLTEDIDGKMANYGVETQTEADTLGGSIKGAQPDIINSTMAQNSGTDTVVVVDLEENVEQPEIIQVTESLLSTNNPTSASTKAVKQNVTQPELSTGTAVNDNDKDAITDNTTREATSPVLPDLIDVRDTPVPTSGGISQKYKDFLATPTGFVRFPIKATANHRTHRPNWDISSPTLSSEVEEEATDTKRDRHVKPPTPEPTTSRRKQDVLIIEHVLNPGPDRRTEFQPETPDLDSNFLELQGRPDGTLGPPTRQETNSSDTQTTGHEDINGAPDTEDDDVVLLNGHDDAADKPLIWQETNSSDTQTSGHLDINGDSDTKDDDVVLLNGHGNATDNYTVPRVTEGLNGDSSMDPGINGTSDTKDGDAVLLNGHGNATDNHTVPQVTGGLNGDSTAGPVINGTSNTQDDDVVLLNGHGNATDKHIVPQVTGGLNGDFSTDPDINGTSDTKDGDAVLLNGHGNATDNHTVPQVTGGLNGDSSTGPVINGTSDTHDDAVVLLNGHGNATDNYTVPHVTEELNGNASADSDLNGFGEDAQTHIQHGLDSADDDVTLLDGESDDTFDLDDDPDTQTQRHPDTTTKPKTIDELMAENHHAPVFVNKTVITAFVRMEKDNDTDMTSSESIDDVIDRLDSHASNIRRTPRRRVTSSSDSDGIKQHRTVIIPAMRVPSRPVIEVPAKRVPSNVETKEIRGLENKRIALPCIGVTGYYPPGAWSFTWKLPNGEEYNRPNKIFSRDWSKYVHRNSSLLLRSLEKTDSGLYTCTAFDEAKQKEYHVQVQLTVATHGPRINNPEREYVRLKAGDPLFLPCSVSGIPTPVSHWETPWGTKIYFSMIVDRIEIFENGTLYIPDVRHDERGAYRCIAQSSAGSAARLVTVTVLMFAPRFLDHPYRTERVGRGESIHLSCRATGYPEPKKYWLLPNGRKININHAMFRSTRHQPKHVVMKNGELILNRADWNDIGRYHCVIANHLGRSASTILLLVTH